MKAFIRIINIFGPTAFLCAFTLPALAEDDSFKFANKPGPELSAAFGTSRIEVNELVYASAGTEYLSHLHWNASAPVIRFSASYDLTVNWSLNGSLMLNIAGNSDLTNRDWIDFDQDGPFRPGSGFDDWTHRSQHPDGDLLRYIDLDMALGRNFRIGDTASVNLHGGLKYNLVEFIARGGDYIYSQNDFRNKHYILPDEIPVINYQQWHRTVFAGATITHNRGNWQFSSLIRTGLSVEPRDIDQHLRRSLRYDDHYDTAAFAQVRLGLTRKMKNGISFFANANYQKYFEEHGDVYLSAIDDGTLLGYMHNSVGTDMSVTTIEIGMARSF